MKRTTFVALVSAVVLLPAAPVGAFGMPDLPGGDCHPEGCEIGEALNEPPTVFIENCAKTRYGVTVRIKMRDNGDFVRIRVSHPQGDGRFREPRVRSVRASVLNYSPDSGPGSVGRDATKDPAPPSFRNYPPNDEFATEVGAKFRLRNGKSIALTCFQR